MLVKKIVPIIRWRSCYVSNVWNKFWLCICKKKEIIMLKMLVWKIVYAFGELFERHSIDIGLKWLWCILNPFSMPHLQHF